MIPGFWYRFLDVVDGALDKCTALIRDTEGAGMFGDHDIDQYIEHIRKWDYQGT